jgi:hypothetical protein
MARYRHVSLLSYVGMLICFSLTFATVSCDGRALGSLSGVDLVTGGALQGPSMFGQAEAREYRGNAGARIALVAAIAGVAVVAMRLRPLALQAVPGIVAGVALLLMKSGIDREIASQGMGLLQVRYAPGYWLTVLLGFVAAAAVIGQHGRGSPPATDDSRDAGDSVPPGREAGVAVASLVTHAAARARPAAAALKAEFVRFREGPWRALDLGGRLRSHRRAVIAAAAGSALVFSGYALFLRPTPAKDARGVARLEAHCDRVFSDARDRVEADLLARIDASAFRTRGEALTRWREEMAAHESGYSECHQRAGERHDRAVGRYQGNRLDRYLNARAYTWTATDRSGTGVVPDRLGNALRGIRAPLPDAGRLPADLVGTSIEGWRFDNAAEFRNVESSVVQGSGEVVTLRATLSLTDYVTEEPYVVQVLVDYREDPDGEWQRDRITPLLVAREDRRYLDGGEVFLVGRWRWPNNHAAYAADGTWRSRWEDGSESSGTWRIVHDRLILTRNGAPWWTGRIQVVEDHGMWVGDGTPTYVQRAGAGLTRADSTVAEDTVHVLRTEPAVIDDPDGHSDIRAGA